MKNLLRQVNLNRANRKADKSVSITFVTQLEQTSEDFIEIDENLGQNGVLYFKPNGELTTKEIEEISKTEIEVEGKTKSQRLRNVLYRLWEQTENSITFNEFYSQRMEQLIEQIKDRLV
jgi:hypothetical protein